MHILSKGSLILAIMFFTQCAFGQSSPWSIELKSTWLASEKLEDIRIVGSNNEPVIHFTYISSPEEVSSYNHLQLGINYKLSETWTIQSGIARESFFVKFTQLAISRGVEEISTNEQEYNHWLLPIGLQYQLSSFLKFDMGVRLGSFSNKDTEDILGVFLLNELPKSSVLPYVGLSLSLPISENFQLVSHFNLLYREAWFQDKAWKPQMGIGLAFAPE